MSKGEEKITDLLNLDKYKFVREKTFSDLKGGRFRYDFYVKDVHGADCIIEFNGEQHYHFVKKFYKTEREWRTAQEHDRRKISYALANNIPIYIIPFWELPKITSAHQLFQDKYRARTR
jgi:hypothetical protein